MAYMQRDITEGLKFRGGGLVECLEASIWGNLYSEFYGN